MMAFVLQTIRSLFFSLDKIIYGLIEDVYSLLLLITRTSIFSGHVIAEFASRIYAIAGIFMLFKVSISVIHYVINPDDFTEKEKGFASIWKRILFSLVMLVITPYIFHEAYILQAVILEENTIMNLIFGSPGTNELPNEDYAQNAGKHIQFTLMYSFMRPNIKEFYGDSNYDLSACENTYVMNNGSPVPRDDNQFIYQLDSACFGTYTPDTFAYDGALSRAFEEALVDEKHIYQNYAQGIAQQNFNILMRQDIILAKDHYGRYLIDYRYFVSTAVGIAVVYLLALFCIDIAIRSVKLGFLQMISPIPILSYIDPKSGKDGMFKKWYKMCFSTYMSLFLRLFALFLGIYAITVLGGYFDFVTGEPIKGNWLLNVFMIIGVLMFAKQLPKIIEDIFGIKLDGSFQLNPLKRLEDDKHGMLGGKRITGAAGGALMGLTSRGLAGALGGFKRGAMGNKGWSDSRSKEAEVSKKLREAKMNGYNPWRIDKRIGGTLAGMTGLPGEAEQLERREHEIKEAITREENAMAKAKEENAGRKQYTDKVKAMEDRAVSKIKGDEAGDVSKQWRRLEATALKAQKDFEEGRGGVTAQDVANAQFAANDYLNGAGMYDYMDSTRAGGSVAGGGTDAAMASMYDDLAQIVRDHKSTDALMEYGTTSSSIHSAAGKVTGNANATARTSIRPHEDKVTELKTEQSALYDRKARAKAYESARGATRGGK